MLFLCICLISLSCKRSFKSNTCQFLDLQMAKKGSIVIRLDTITSFKWETLYVFNNLETRKHIENTYGLKVKTDFVSDDCTLYAFFTGNESVFEELTCFDSEECSIDFLHSICLSKNTVYRVRKVKSENHLDKRNHYNFQPIKENFTVR